MRAVVAGSLGLAVLFAAALLFVLLNRGGEPHGQPAALLVQPPVGRVQPTFTVDERATNPRATTAVEAPPLPPASPSPGEPSAGAAHTPGAPEIAVRIDVRTPDGRPLTEAGRGVFDGLWWFPVRAIATSGDASGATTPSDVARLERREPSRFVEWCEHQGSRTPASLGCLEYPAPARQWVSLLVGSHRIATRAVPPGDRSVEFEVPIATLEALAGTVTIRLVDDGTGLPLAGATGLLADGEVRAGAEADADGRITFRWQPPVRTGLSVGDASHEQYDESIQISPGTLDLGTIRLLPATVTLRGFVRDGAGVPQATVVTAWAIDDSGRPLPGLSEADMSGEDGAFELPRLGPRRYHLGVVSADSAAAPLIVDARQGDVADIDLVVERGTQLVVEPRWPADEPFGLSVVTEAGWVLDEAEPWPSDWPWSRRVVPGRYTLVLLLDGRIATTRRVDVAGETAVIQLRP